MGYSGSSGGDIGASNNSGGYCSADFCGGFYNSNRGYISSNFYDGYYNSNIRYTSQDSYGGFDNSNTRYSSKDSYGGYYNRNTGYTSQDSYSGSYNSRDGKQNFLLSTKEQVCLHNRNFANFILYYSITNSVDDNVSIRWYGFYRGGDFLMGKVIDRIGFEEKNFLECLQKKLKK